MYVETGWVEFKKLIIILPFLLYSVRLTAHFYLYNGTNTYTPLYLSAFLTGSRTGLCCRRHKRGEWQPYMYVDSTFNTLYFKHTLKYAVT